MEDLWISPDEVQEDPSPEARSRQTATVVWTERARGLGCAVAGGRSCWLCILSSTTCGQREHGPPSHRGLVVDSASSPPGQDRVPQSGTRTREHWLQPWLVGQSLPHGDRSVFRAQVLLHHTGHSVFLNAVLYSLQHHVQPLIQGLQVQLVQDRRHLVPLQ